VTDPNDTAGSDKPFCQAALHRRLEQLAQQVAVSESVGRFFEKGRVIQDVALSTELAEPARRGSDAAAAAETVLHSASA
jgi:hypothetical protein